MNNLLEAVFSGVRAIVREVGMAAREAVGIVLQEIDRSPIGRAATRILEGTADRLFRRASDLADEEAELAEKFRTDGQRSDADAERLAEIEAERDRLREEASATKAAETRTGFANDGDKVVAVPASSDETSAVVGLMSSKVCPECGGTMTLRQSRYNVGLNERRFWWQCKSLNGSGCPTIKVDPSLSRNGEVLRKPNPDLDGKREQRRKIWLQDGVAAKTHQRIRESLDEKDKAVLCPHHVLPMKLVEKPGAGRLMLDSYEYICPGVSHDGKACAHKIPLETYPQAAEHLRRRDGVGIVDSV
ncbi:MAG: hypothetical protein JNL68_01755 [Burkholderiales bacterium]|nr:hypothetical protein [Burkholderiales bacterium]